MDGLVWLFHPSGLLDYVETPSGHRITARHDQGDLVELSHSSGQKLQLAYDSSGRLTSLTSQRGDVTDFEYDPSGELLVAVHDAHGRSTRYKYETDSSKAAHFALTEIEFPGGLHRNFDYGPRGELLRTSGEGGSAPLTFGRDGAGALSVRNAERVTAWNPSRGDRPNGGKNAERRAWLTGHLGHRECIVLPCGGSGRGQVELGRPIRSNSTRYDGHPHD